MKPWHFQYVGAPHATIMRNHDFVLEEYIDMLRSYPYGEASFCFNEYGSTFKISFVKAGRETTKIAILDTFNLISGNNVDGFIVTSWCKK